MELAPPRSSARIIFFTVIMDDLRNMIDNQVVYNEYFLDSYWRMAYDMCALRFSFYTIIHRPMVGSL